MWRNYLTVGLRALTKDRTYAFINIFGLALGLAACLLLLLYVRYETSYDAWLPDAERVYQVQAIHTDPETGERSVQQGSHGIIEETLPKDFPQIEAISRADIDTPVFIKDGEATQAEIVLAEPNFFDIVELPFLAGNRATALANADSIVLSRSEAIRRFGRADVLGQTVTRLRRGEKADLRVTGVLEDLPRNSHMEINAVARITAQDKEGCGWGCINGTVYLKLRPGASADDINARLQAWERRNIPTSTINGVTVSEGTEFDWRLVNVRDVHLSEAEPAFETRPTNDRRTIVTFAVVAVLILGMAAVNFINLATARASRRAREVALRKVLGARRRQLMLQFLGESLLLTALAMVIALALVELTRPMFASFLGADLKLHYFGAGGLFLPIVGLLLAVGLAGGLYPAFYLSRFRPSAVLKANRSTAEPAGSGQLRNLLVVAQFAVSIGLIICTAVVWSQTRFAQSVDPGYRRDGIIEADNLNRAAMIPVTETLLREVAKVEGVRGVAGSNIWPASGQTLNTRVQVPGRTNPLTLGLYSVTPSFFETMGVKLVAGRTLSRVHARDFAWSEYEPEEAVEPSQRALVARGINVVVNRLAAEQMGYSDPAQALGKTIGLNQFGEELGLLPATVVGVVENSRFRSLREPVEAMIYFDRGVYSHLLVQYSAADPEQVRDGVRRVWKRLAPEVPFQGNYSDAELADLYRADRARGTSFAGFALLAIVIACLGLFGLAAFTAERRTKEIGIRKVFGATVTDIVKLLAWQFSKPVVIANLIAWPVAWWVMRDWLNTFDSRVALGPGPFVLAGLLALAIAIGTIAGHAIRVARTNPIHALRYE